MKPVKRLFNKADKTLTEFSQDPNQYLEQSSQNFQKMPPNRQQKVVTNALVTGAVTTVAGAGVAALSGSNSFGATCCGLVAGLATGATQACIQTHNYSTFQRVADSVKTLGKVLD